MQTTRRPLKVLFLLLLALVAPLRDARAELVRVEVSTRSDIGSSGFEKIVGIAHFEIDPANERNAVIADVGRAPRTAGGKVAFSADLYIIRPKDEAKSNGIALVEVLNRGRKLVMNGFIRNGANDPASEADLGDRFLLDRGFTLVWVGWEFDVRRQNGQMGISVPSTQGLFGQVSGDFTPSNDNAVQTVGDLVGYAPADPAAADSTLTVRDRQYAKAETIARGKWSIAGNTVTLQGGFQAGRIYTVTYRAKELPVSGLGLAAFRDTGSWIKHNPSSLVRATQTLAFGSSQSGRFLRTFLYAGMNGDEQGRQVFDAAWVHIAGAAGLDVNARGATPTSLTMYTITRFPYANQALTDPLTGRVDGLLVNPRARAFRPKMFFTNTSVEYWGGGRSAALVHTSPDSKTDLDLGPDTRVYYLTGAQHGPARFPTSVGNGQQPDNPLEYWWTMRALMAGMERWMKTGAAPPESRYPKLADGTLVPARQVAFPALPGVQSPRGVEPLQRDEKPVPFLVPQVDTDGNEVAGVRTPESLVPMATYTGWNFRNLSSGGGHLLVSLLGSRIPFPKTAAEASASHDPRKPVAERYASKDAYMTQARQVADDLVKGGYLLPGDVAQVMRRMDAQWGEATK